LAEQVEPDPGRRFPASLNQTTHKTIFHDAVIEPAKPARHDVLCLDFRTLNRFCLHIPAPHKCQTTEYVLGCPGSSDSILMYPAFTSREMLF
jgi:hypothetical protein